MLSLLETSLATTASQKLQQCKSTRDCPGASQCFVSFDEHNVAKDGYCVQSDRKMDASVESTSFLEMQSKPDVFSPTGMKVASLTVQAPRDKTAEVVLLSDKSQAYSVGVDAAGVFRIQQEGQKPALEITPNGGEIIARTRLLAAGALRSQDGFFVQDTMQWALWREEEFTKGSEGWGRLSDSASKSSQLTTQCPGGVWMLGGFRTLSKDSVSKTFAGLPAHNRLRVVATYHFIDRWEGQMGFMKIGASAKDSHYVWTERYDVNDYTDLLDVCGGPTGEGHFSSTIDVSMYHTNPSVELLFGSTFDINSGGAPGFYGVSSVQVYVRTVPKPLK